MRESDHTTATEMRSLLREAYSHDPEKSFFRQFGSHFQDPSAPNDANKRPRLHPLWLTLGIIAAVVVAIFAYFSLQS